jgi:hypothetical protein
VSKSTVGVTMVTTSAGNQASGASDSSTVTTNLKPTLGNWAALAPVEFTSAGQLLRRTKDVQLRPYPFPYAAALSISTDSKHLDCGKLSRVMDLVCGSRPTPLGDGLGLEMSGSIALLPQPSVSRLCFLSADGLVTNKASASIGRLTELAQNGWIDTLDGAHSSSAVGQGLAEIGSTDLWFRSLDTMNNLGIRLMTYIESTVTGPDNALNGLNRASIGGSEAALGVRFFSPGSMCEAFKFGDHLDYRQPARLALEVNRYIADKAALGKLDPMSGVFAEASLFHEVSPPAEVLSSLFNRTILETRLPNGKVLLLFKRYRGTHAPSISNLPIQLASSRLDSLEKMGGAVIVAQSLGSWSLVGRSAQSHPSRPATDPLFDEHGLVALQDLAIRAKQGRILVATTGRLLGLVRRHAELQIVTTKSRDHWQVRVTSTKSSGTPGGRLDGTELNGLSMIAPENAPEIRVEIEGRSQPVIMTRSPDTVYPGHICLSLPWQPLVWGN